MGCAVTMASATDNNIWIILHLRYCSLGQSSVLVGCESPKMTGKEIAAVREDCPHTSTTRTVEKIQPRQVLMVLTVTFYLVPER